MGFLGKLFGGDPRKDLTKAEGHLAAGRAHRTIELARKAASSGDEEIREQAAAIEKQAREALIDNALSMATSSEESEFWEDAVEWLDRALEQIDEQDRKVEIAARRQALLQKIEDAEEEAWQARSSSV